jgi:hypothetical protein
MCVRFQHFRILWAPFLGVGTASLLDVKSQASEGVDEYSRQPLEVKIHTTSDSILVTALEVDGLECLCKIFIPSCNE